MRFLANTIFALGLLCTSQVYAESTPLGLRLEDGATYRWVSVNERTTESPKGKQSSKVTTPFSLSVLKRTKEAFVVELKYGKSELLSSAESPEIQKFLSVVQEIVQSLKFRIVVGNEGEILDVQNFDEVQSVVSELINKLAESTKLPEQMKTQMQSMFSSKQAIVGVLLKDIPLLFVGASADINAKTPINYDTELPNPLGGAPFKASGITTISRIANSSNTFRLETRQTVDPESVRQIVAQLVPGKMNKIEEQNLKQQLSGMNIQDYLVSTVAIKTGLSKNVRFVRATTVNDTKRVDIREFALAE